jgi:hypothetical protein
MFSLLPFLRAFWDDWTSFRALTWLGYGVGNMETSDVGLGV